MNLRARLYRRWMREVSYKRPGYRLDWSDEHGLAIVIDTFDADDEAEIIEQTHSFGYPTEGISRKEFHDWVFHCLILQSLHEVGEFLMIDGRRLYHPHKDSLDVLSEAFGHLTLDRFAETARMRNVR